MTLRRDKDPERAWAWGTAPEKPQKPCVLLSCFLQGWGGSRPGGMGEFSESPCSCLRFRFNSIQALSEASFAGLTKLGLLMLHGNNIPSIPDGALSDLSSLQVKAGPFMSPRSQAFPAATRKTPPCSLVTYSTVPYS